MTVPGVYSPEQIAAHVDKVIASDGVDDSRAVEVMAEAMAEKCGFTWGAMQNPQEMAWYDLTEQNWWRDAARAALGALRALEGE